MNIYRSSNVYILGFSDPAIGTSIYSNGIGLMCVYLMSQGAGGGLDIYCHNSDTCYVECGAASACNSGTGTTIYCENTATCLVKCNFTLGLDCPAIAQGNYTIVTAPPKDSLAPTTTLTDAPETTRSSSTTKENSSIAATTFTATITKSPANSGRSPI